VLVLIKQQVLIFKIKIRTWFRCLNVLVLLIIHHFPKKKIEALSFEARFCVCGGIFNSNQVPHWGIFASSACLKNHFHNFHFLHFILFMRIITYNNQTNEWHMLWFKMVRN
jgi:hypothetical protein